MENWANGLVEKKDPNLTWTNVRIQRSFFQDTHLSPAKN